MPEIEILSVPGSSKKFRCIAFVHQNESMLSRLNKHYRREYLPDMTFLRNTARDTLEIPEDKLDEFVSILIDDLKGAELLEDVGGKQWVLDVTHTADAIATTVIADQHLKKVSKGVMVQPTDTCFVMMPFADPLGTYYGSVYEPAIKKAGLIAVRAEADIYGTGKNNRPDMKWNKFIQRAGGRANETQSECAV
jgi:hypothetical protein